MYGFNGHDKKGFFSKRNAKTIIINSTEDTSKTKCLIELLSQLQSLTGKIADNHKT